MMAPWMACSVIFAALVGGGASLAELTLPPGAARRHVWTAALGLSVGGAALALVLGGAWPWGLLPAAPAADLAALIASAPAASGAVLPLPEASAGRPVDLSAALAGAWTTLSLLVLTLYGGVWLRFSGASAEWGWARLAGRSVRVARRLGPAVVGVRRSTIVVPEWVLRADAAVQHMIIVHETEHERARDHVLLGLAPLAVILLPWNLPLWWQLHRLRLAVEVDCDRRVLGRGVDMRAYGSLLIEIAGRPFPVPATFAALAEPRTLLERRIVAMSTRTNPDRMRRTACAVGAGALLVAALETFTFLTPAAAATGSGPVFPPSPVTGTHGEVAAAEQAGPAGEAEAGEQLARARQQVATDTPLIVVDGVFIGGGDVRAAIGDARIVSIEVVQGVAAVARYGATAAGGAIVITTSRSRPAPDEQRLRERAADAETARLSELRRGIGGATQATPLYIVDGVIVGTIDPMRDLEPADILSIEIIKGPAAARLYGDRAAGGVVTITTRRRDPPVPGGG